MKSKHKLIPRPCRKFLQTKRRTQTRFPVLAQIEAGPFPGGNLSGWQKCSTLSSHTNSKPSHADTATHWNSEMDKYYFHVNPGTVPVLWTGIFRWTWSQMFRQCFACWCIIRSTVCWLRSTDNPAARCMSTAGRGEISDWENSLSPFCFFP